MPVFNMNYPFKRIHEFTNFLVFAQVNVSPVKFYTGNIKSADQVGIYDTFTHDACMSSGPIVWQLPLLGLPFSLRIKQLSRTSP